MREVESTENTECQAFFPIVRIGSTHLLARKRVLKAMPNYQNGTVNNQPTTLEGGGGVGWDHRVHRVATAYFWRTFHQEGKINPGW